ncbi:MAG TPA: rhomboid family intramembrane serine protease [Thiothrix sp.]|nr:rhomboid family intramembrane serine protease [Thiothrix sp.]
MGKLYSSVTLLILANILLFLVSTLWESSALNTLDLYFPENTSFNFWQYLSHLFIHDNVPHLLFNMLALWLFGSKLEKVWGNSQFLLFYLISGIGAAAIYTLINYYQFSQTYNDLINLGVATANIEQTLTTGMYSSTLKAHNADIAILLDIYTMPLVGSSGAIYGVLVAFIMTFPQAKLPFILPQWQIMLKYFIPAVIALDVFSGVTGLGVFDKNVAHFVHVGGAIVGLVLMLHWKKR